MIRRACGFVQGLKIAIVMLYNSSRTDRMINPKAKISITCVTTLS